MTPGPFTQRSGSARRLGTSTRPAFSRSLTTCAPGIARACKQRTSRSRRGAVVLPQRHSSRRLPSRHVHREGGISFSRSGNIERGRRYRGEAVLATLTVRRRSDPRSVQFPSRRYRAESRARYSTSAHGPRCASVYTDGGAASDEYESDSRLPEALLPADDPSLFQLAVIFASSTNTVFWFRRPTLAHESSLLEFRTRLKAEGPAQRFFFPDAHLGPA